MWLLGLMVMQNSASVLVGRFTRSSTPIEDQYDVSHFMVSTEALKLVLSCVLLQLEGGSFELDGKMAVPSLLYFVQNSLVYHSLGYVEVPLFQAAYQSKLVSTAFLSAVFLGRQYNRRQWACLLSLTLGVALVVWEDDVDGGSSEADAETDSSPTSHQKDTTNTRTDSVYGLLLIAIACLCSSLAGVYFEKIIKAKKAQSLWARNIQLSLFTLVTAALQNYYDHAVNGVTDSSSNIKPFFWGFTPWVYLQMALLGAGGLLVATVVKYTDQVQKGLATGLSVVVSTLLSTIFFGTTISFSFVVGAAMIIISIFFFANDCGRSSLKLVMVCIAILQFRVLYMHVYMISPITTTVPLGWLPELSSSSSGQQLATNRLPILRNNKNLSFSYMRCRGKPLHELSDVNSECIHSTIRSPKNNNSSNRINITIDIMSIGSKHTIGKLETQANTWASHSSVRFFLGATEDDEADPSCHTNLTKAQMKSISNFCRTESKKRYNYPEGRLMKYMSNFYATANYLETKTPGWLCANKRPGVIFAKIGRIYKALSTMATSNSLPDYLIYLDDDGYYNLDWFQTHFSQEMNPSIPTAHAGCVVQSPLHDVNFSFPYGGYGTILSRGTIINLLRPLHCSGNHTFDDEFLNHSCAQIQKNMFGERESFSEGMSVSDLMGAHAVRDSYANMEQFQRARYPFCLHGDWTTGYYLNYYQLSNQILEPWYKDRPQFRIEQSLGRIYRKSTGNCLNDGDQNCHARSQICHHISSEKMENLTKSWKV